MPNFCAINVFNDLCWAWLHANIPLVQVRVAHYVKQIIRECGTTYAALFMLLLCSFILTNRNKDGTISART